MSSVFFGTKINGDGTMVIPAFAVRGLGYGPEDEVSLTVAAEPCICDCIENEVFIGRCCGEASCVGYTSNESRINIPVKMLSQAGLPAEQDVHVITAGGMLLLLSVHDELSGLPAELIATLEELGLNPVTAQLAWEDEKKPCGSK